MLRLAPQIFKISLHVLEARTGRRVTLVRSIDSS